MENVTQMFAQYTYINETSVEIQTTDWVTTKTTANQETTAKFENQTEYITDDTPVSTEFSYNDKYPDEYSYSDYYDFDYGDVYMYPGYAFERPVYLYFWEILVILTCAVNVIVISVLLRRKMRNPTNIVLAAIAISDSLTGLVTLPTYIMVFLRYDPVHENTGYDYYAFNYTDGGQYEYFTTPVPGETMEAVDGYTLTKSLCQAFMISKYFLSKSFHTMSIFLTLFLGIQRYISIAFPYKAQLLMNLNRTLISCVVIACFSPVLHIYHLVGKKAFDGLCQWELSENGCGPGCIYLWIAFFIRHFIPCVALVTFTVMFIFQLRAGVRTLRRMDSNPTQLSRRSEENRRISFVVTAVVIVFLIPEVPYGVFLLYNAIDKSANDGKGIHLETNRAIHMVYELFLVLSFHANFYIYTLFNRRFRKTLYRTYFNPIRRLFGYTNRLSFSRSSSSTHRPSTRKLETGSTRNKFEMETMITNGQQQSDMVDTKVAETNLDTRDMTTFQGDTNTVEQLT